MFFHCLHPDLIHFFFCCNWNSCLFKLGKKSHGSGRKRHRCCFCLTVPLILFFRKLYESRIRIGVAARIDSCKTPLIGYCRDFRQFPFPETFFYFFETLCTIIGKSIIAELSFFFQFFQNIQNLFHRFLWIISVKPVKIYDIFSKSPAAFFQICADRLPIYSAL